MVWRGDADQPVPPLPYNDAEDWTPDDPSRGRRIDWAALLKRSWLIDVLVCPRCAAPMRVISHIEDERTARRILEHLGLPARAPPRGLSADASPEYQADADVDGATWLPDHG